jgi:RNA polymerase sigma-70 factor (ECF subfamily)
LTESEKINTVPLYGTLSYIGNMSANHLDNTLLTRCLERQDRAWEDFVDRFLGLVLHVIDHTVSKREVRLRTEDRNTLCEQVFAALAHDQFRLLREFKARSSLTTYLSVIVRRIVVRLLLNQSSRPPQTAFGY